MSSYSSKIGSFALLFVIGATAVVLAIVSYSYSVSTAKEISEIAANDVRLKARTLFVTV